MIRFLTLTLLVFTSVLMSCRTVVTNKFNTLSYLCGEDYDANRSYIKVENVPSGQHIEVVGVEDNKLHVTRKGCVERPISGEVFIVNKERTLGAWISRQTQLKIELEPLTPKILPTGCNSVIHGDGRGFNLRFDKQTDTENTFESVNVKMLSLAENSLIKDWGTHPLRPSIEFSFPADTAIASGEYWLEVLTKDDVTGVTSTSKCTLRIDYSKILISPADKIKSKRIFNDQEVLLVEPGYEIDFYVEEGFRQVSIDYCLKKVTFDQISRQLAPGLTTCEETQNFTKSVPQKLADGFWVLNFKGQRGLIESGWQHAVLLVDKMCADTLSIKEMSEQGCTTIKGNLNISDQETSVRLDDELLRKLDLIGQVTGDITISIKNSKLDYFRNLYEVGGSIRLSGENVEELTGFDQLRTIHRNLTLSQMQSIKIFDTFKKLEMIGGNFSIVTNWNIPKLRGFDRLKKAGTLTIWSVATEDLHFPALEEVKKIELQQMARLKNLNGLKNLKTVREIRLNNLESLESLSGLDIQSPMENFELSSLPLLQNLGLIRTKNIRRFTIQNSPRLREGFSPQSETIITHEFVLTGDTAVTDLKGFPLANDFGTLRVSGPNLKSLAVAENVETIARLDISYVPKMSGIEGLAGVTVKNLHISKNDGGRVVISKAASPVVFDTIELTGAGSLEFENTAIAKVPILKLNETSIQDLSFLSAFSSLKTLWLDSTALKDLTGLERIKSLDNLRITLTPTLRSFKGIENLEVRDRLHLHATGSPNSGLDYSSLISVASIGQALDLERVCLSSSILENLRRKIATAYPEPPNSGLSRTRFENVFALTWFECEPSLFR